MEREKIAPKCEFGGSVQITEVSKEDVERREGGCRVGSTVGVHKDASRWEMPVYVCVCMWIKQGILRVGIE